MKLGYTLGALAVAVFAQSAQATTEVKTLPLEPVLSQQPAGSEIALYFGDQAHPAVKVALGDTSQGTRIARRVDDQVTACNRALSEALDKLRSYAHDHNANAIVNIRTNFHSTQTASATEFTCGVSGSAAALRVQGDVVVLEAK
jgi:uncharacterized protein YbjQ (UPF0145 family)